MTRMLSVGSWCVTLGLGLTALGCTPGGVGDPCTPEDEYQQYFSGFQVSEVNVESRSFQCETRLCLVNHFQGRVSCRLGQETQVDDAGNPLTGASYHPKCSIPGTAASNDPNSADNVNVKVKAQLVARQTDQAVYCSCRCDGPDKNARYCECPDGFQCEPLIKKLSIGGSEKSGQLAGSYCIRAGTKYDPEQSTEECAVGTCGCNPNAKEWPAECGAKQ